MAEQKRDVSPPTDHNNHRDRSHDNDGNNDNGNNNNNNWNGGGFSCCKTKPTQYVPASQPSKKRKLNNGGGKNIEEKISYNEEKYNLLCAVEYNCKNRGQSQPLQVLQQIDSNKLQQLNDSPLGEHFLSAAKCIFSDVNETYVVVRNNHKIRIIHTINGTADGQNIVSILNETQKEVVICALQNECGCDIAIDSHKTQIYAKVPLALSTKRAAHECATKYGLQIERVYNQHFGLKGGIHCLSIRIGRDLDANQNNLNNLIAAAIQLRESEKILRNKQIESIKRWRNNLVRRCSQLSREKSVLYTITRILYEGTETQIKQKTLELYLHPFTLLCNVAGTTFYDISYNETGKAITAMTNIGAYNEAKRLGNKMKNEKYIYEAKCLKIAKNKYKNEVVVEFLDEAKCVRFAYNRRTAIEIKEMTPDKYKDVIISHVLSGELKETEDLFRLLDNLCLLIILNFNYTYDLFGTCFDAISSSLTKTSLRLGDIVGKLSECNMDFAEQHKIIPWLHFIASWCNNYNYSEDDEWSTHLSHYLLDVLFECMGHANYNNLFSGKTMSQVRMADDIFWFLIKVHQNECVALFRRHLNDNLISNVLFDAIKLPQILSSLISINNDGIISILEPLTFQKLQRLDGEQKKKLVFNIVYPQINAICNNSLSIQVFGIIFPFICCLGNRELFSLLTNQTALIHEINEEIDLAMELNQRPVIN